MGTGGSKGSSTDILFITAMSNHTKFDKEELLALLNHFNEVAKKKKPFHLIARDEFKDVLKQGKSFTYKYIYIFICKFIYLFIYFLTTYNFLY